MPKQPEPGRDALVYNPSKVSWAVAETIAMPPSGVVRMALYFIVLLLVGAVAFAHFTKVSVTVAGAGMIRTSAKIIPVRTEAGGKIAVLNVADGKPVKKGEVLIELDGQLDEASSKRAKALISRLDALVKMTDNSEATREAGLLAQEPMRMTLTSLVRERTVLAEATSSLYQALRGLADVGALSAADRSETAQAEAKIAKIKSQGLEGQLQNELADLEATVARANVSMRGRRDQAVQRILSARAALEVQIRAFELSLEEHQRGQRILSPADGILTKVSVNGVGEVINAGQILFEVIPSGGSLVAEVQIQNRDIAQLTIGMPVLLRLDAMPYQDYGVLPGKIAEIPPDATVVREGAPATYQIKVALDRTSLEGPQGRREVILGMTLLVEIQIRRMTLLELLLVEILKLKDLV